MADEISYSDFQQKWIGNEIESSIYKKIISKKAKISDFLSTNGNYDIFLNKANKNS